MKEVRRWLAVPLGGDAVRLVPADVVGPQVYVCASDYDALAARLRRLRG